MDDASEDTVRRALRLLESSRKSARDYYSRNADVIKRRSAVYWAEHRSELNRKRRERYAAARMTAAGASDAKDYIRHE